MTQDEFNAEVAKARALIHRASMILANLEDIEDDDAVETLGSARDHLSEAHDSLASLPFPASEARA